VLIRSCNDSTASAGEPEIHCHSHTIKPIITAAVAKDTLVHTDEYSIYARLPAWGYQHKTVCHGRGEYARDEDGDGFYEVHVNTMEMGWTAPGGSMCQCAGCEIRQKGSSPQ